MTGGTLLALVFALGWIPLFVYRAEGLTEALPTYRGAERFWVCATPVLLALHVSLACLTLNATGNVSRWGAAAGLAVFATALALWFSGRVRIGPLRRRRLPDEPPLRLRRDGAFAVVRHPLYASYLLACAAPVLVLRRGYLVATYGVCVIAVATRAIQEERRLRAQLGAEYDAYCRDVKRLVPFVW